MHALAIGQYFTAAFAVRRKSRSPLQQTLSGKTKKPKVRFSLYIRGFIIKPGFEIRFMVKWHWLSVLVLLTAGCKKAFVPAGALANDSKYLVVDGVINSGNDSTFIRLSRTKKFDTVINITNETGAQVTVESDAGVTFPLTEIKSGIYATGGLNLDNSHKYRLNIKTTNAEQYASDYIAVKNSPAIDSLGFIAQADGIHVYVNSHDNSKATRYYRWEFNEAWQFSSFYESYLMGDNPHHICYQSDTSGAVLIASTTKLSNDVVYQAPIVVIPGTSEKIETKYTILVKQYALSSDAYNFWQNLQKNTNQLGSLFDAQPSTNQTNYHCLSNPAEIVVGYLSVGSVAIKRIFVLSNQLPVYHTQYPYQCPLDSAFYYHQPFYFDPQVLGPNSGYTAIDAFYVAPLGPFGAPNFKTYSRTTCVDCTVRGSLNPPYYWK